ncbi:MAG: CvpA family protein [Synergistaceae bacterium]|jgi:membrane protein required for colicin V production|nr:CvpA family protein [Synergistaceae bacterium]
MSAVDIILLMVGLFFVVRGLMKGLSGEIISLIGTVGGFVCAIRFYEPFAAILVEKFGASATVSTILAMLAIFSVIFFGCSMLEMGIKKVLSKTNLTLTDKFLGAVVGLFKMYVISLMVLIGGGIVSPMTGDAWMRDSRVLQIASVTFPYVSPLMERAGILPDFAAIQEDARNYITRQAGSAIMGASGDLLPGTGMPGLPGIGIPGLLPAISGDGMPTSNDETP